MIIVAVSSNYTAGKSIESHIDLHFADFIVSVLLDALPEVSAVCYYLIVAVRLAIDSYAYH